MYAFFAALLTISCSVRFYFSSLSFGVCCQIPSEHFLHILAGASNSQFSAEMVHFGGRPSAGCQTCRSKKIRVSLSAGLILSLLTKTSEVRPATWWMRLLPEEGVSLPGLPK